MTGTAPASSREPVGQPFKNHILQPCQHLRDAKLALETLVGLSVDGAADRAAFPVLPISSLDDLICVGVTSHPREVVRFDGGVRVK